MGPVQPRNLDYRDLGKGDELDQSMKLIYFSVDWSARRRFDSPQQSVHDSSPNKI